MFSVNSKAGVGVFSVISHCLSSNQLLAVLSASAGTVGCCVGRGAPFSIGSSAASWRCRTTTAADVTAEWNTSRRTWVSSLWTLRDTWQCWTTSPARPADYTETSRTTCAGLPPGHLLLVKLVLSQFASDSLQW